MNLMKNTPKTVSAFFYLFEPEAVGHIVVMHTLSYIAHNFNAVVYTNHYGFLKSRFPDMQVVSLEHLKIKRMPLLGKMLYWRKVAAVLNADPCDVVFLGQDSAPVALWLNKLCVQYIFQAHEIIGLGNR